MPDPAIRARLEYLRGEIEAERISMSEVIELQGLAEHIEAGDTQLLEWAGVPEFPEASDRITVAGLIAKLMAAVPVAEDRERVIVVVGEDEIEEPCEFVSLEYILKQF